jgi:hypothetical protein
VLGKDTEHDIMTAITFADANGAPLSRSQIIALASRVLCEKQTADETAELQQPCLGETWLTGFLKRLQTEFIRMKLVDGISTVLDLARVTERVTTLGSATPIQLSDAESKHDLDKHILTCVRDLALGGQGGNALRAALEMVAEELQNLLTRFPVRASRRKRRPRHPRAGPIAAAPRARQLSTVADADKEVVAMATPQIDNHSGAGAAAEVAAHAPRDR